MFSIYVSVLLYASYGIMFYGFNTLWLKLWFKGLKLMDLFGYDTLGYIYIFKMFFNILCLVLVCTHAYVAFVVLYPCCFCKLLGLFPCICRLLWFVPCLCSLYALFPCTSS